ncbi:hypothetical protein BDV06DRAFT_199797 [Aspergillus oleicola]
MASIRDDALQLSHFPSMRSLSSTSNPADMTEDRRLPPLPRIEPLQRDLFNPFTHKNFMPSPPSTHETFPVRSSRPPAEHIVPPLSPATTDDSWTDSKPLQKTLRGPLDPRKMSGDSLIDLIAPDKSSITRKLPLQQPCGRKRKATMMLAESDEQREKHRVAEGNRRKNLSLGMLQMTYKLSDYFLECAGWNRQKNQPESKEHIIQATLLLIEFLEFIVIWCVREVWNNEVPERLKDEMNVKLRCMELERKVSRLIQQDQKSQHEIAALKRHNQALEERNRVLEYQLSAREHLLRSPQIEHPSPQQATGLPDSNPRAMLPGMRVFCDELAVGTPDSARCEVLSMGAPQSFGHRFPSHTPSTTGPSPPVSHQGAHPMTISRASSFAQSP